MGLKERQAEIFAALNRYSNALWRASKFVKIVLIIGGALVVAIGLAIDVAKANGEVSYWTLAGIFGAIFVAAGSAFDAIRETDAASGCC
jgi:hypothetical protein